MTSDHDFPDLRLLGLFGLIDGVHVPPDAAHQVSQLARWLVEQRQKIRPNDASVWQLADHLDARPGGPLIWATEDVALCPQFWVPRGEYRQLLELLDALRSLQNELDLQSFSYHD